MLKKILLVLFATTFALSLFAQNQVIPKLKQPPPNKLGIADLWSLELNNTTKQEIKGYITGSLSEDKDGTIVEGQSKPFIIKPGRSTYAYKDFSDADIRYNNNKYKEILLRTGGAPEGDYTICVEVYSEEGDVIGIENCIYHSVRQLGNISLLTPADGDETNPEQPVIFSWTPLPDAKEYSLKIVELIGNQSPESALQQNPPFFAKENIKATQFQYPITERKFQSDKSYAWLISSNGVLSDIGLFKVKSASNNNVAKSFTQYRFTVMFPEGEISNEEMASWSNELEPIIQSFKVNDGMPNRISMNFTVPKLTQKIKSIEEARSTFEQLVASIETLEELPFGDDVIILSGKQGNCPPADCGCDKPGAIHYCKCVMYQGICMCNICPDKCVMTEMEVEDPVLELKRVINPPSGNDSTKIKDVILVLASSHGDQCESFKKGLKNGLKIVNDLRKANKIENLVIKQSYKSESPKDVKYRITLMYPDGGIDVSEVSQLQNDLEQTVNSMKIDGGMPNRISMNVTVPKQITNSKTETEVKQLADVLFNLVEAQTEFPFGKDVIVIAGKQNNCPPDGCGCDKPGAIIGCNCGTYQGFCFCNICADKCTISVEEEDDPTLEIKGRVSNPPTVTDSFKVKDVIIVLTDSRTEECEAFNKILISGLQTVDEQREIKKVGNLFIKQSYKSASSKEIIYRFILSYPESAVRISGIDSLQNDLDEAFSMMKIDSGMPNRISMNVTVGKQTQQSSIGERVNSEKIQLAENLFNIIESVDEFPFGDDVIILGAKQSGGDCPPAGCGCENPGAIHYCSCVVYQGTCMCKICPDKVVLKDMEVEDPVLQFRTIQTPPVKNDSTIVKDIIIVFTDSKIDELNSIKAGINVGLETVDNLRKNNKDKDRPIKVHYDLKENIK